MTGNFATDLGLGDVLSLAPVLGALLAGNTVLLKPSEVTPATGVMIEKLLRSLPELAPYVRVLHGDGAVGAALVQAKPDFIFLTGSTATGRVVSRAAAEHLIPVACELGGKDAMLVLEDADMLEMFAVGSVLRLFNPITATEIETGQAYEVTDIDSDTKTLTIEYTITAQP